MSKLKGIKDMSAAPVKKAGEEAQAAPVIKTKRVRSKRKHRAGIGSFKPTVIMKDLSGQFVKIKRGDVLKHIEIGWVTVPRSKYRAALKEGAIAPAVAEVAAKKKKKRK
jgi:hypothetical protein